jgi:hypothetical protein
MSTTVLLLLFKIQKLKFRFVTISRTFYEKKHKKVKKLFSILFNIIFKETKKEIREIEEKLVKVREECAAFTEHEAPNAPGKKYYYNVKTSQSTWDKPKCLSELPG